MPVLLWVWFATPSLSPPDFSESDSVSIELQSGAALSLKVAFASGYLIRSVYGSADSALLSNETGLDRLKSAVAQLFDTPSCFQGNFCPSEMKISDAGDRLILVTDDERVDFVVDACVIPWLNPAYPKMLSVRRKMIQLSDDWLDTQSRAADHPTAGSGT